MTIVHNDKHIDDIEECHGFEMICDVDCCSCCI